VSHRRQYELQQLARELGFAQVVAIDDDLVFLAVAVRSARDSDVY
jgi:hypothetical protein